LVLYTEVFEQAGAINRLEKFASEFGPHFYGLPLNESRVQLRRDSWLVPAEYAMSEHTLVPLRAGESLSWRFAGVVR
jgi:dihydroorotase